MLEGTETINKQSPNINLSKKSKENGTAQTEWQYSDTAEHHRQTTINTKVRIS